jgi:hypothetical protein
MSRSVVVALVLVAAILGGAALLYDSLFGEPVEVAQNGDNPDGPKVPVRAVKKDAGVVEKDAGVPVTQTARVLSTRGLVEVRNAEGKWVPATPGQELASSESVRTGRNGEANLDVGDGIEVRVSPRSEFSVRDLQAEYSRIRLEEGHVAAQVDSAKARALQVEAKGSDAVAESKGGAFGVVTDGKGQLTVATQKGAVKLTSKGRTVEVAEGQTSMVMADGEGPTAPKEIPKSLFLKLQAPSQRRTNQATTTIEGTTAPGSVVRVAGQVSRADEKGRFRVKVKLKEGTNKVPVNVLDASGRRTEASSPEIVLDRKKPKIETDMQWGTGSNEGGDSKGG